MLSFSPHKHTVTSATTRSQRLRMGHLKARPLSMSFTSQPIRWTRFEVGCSVALRDCECCESQPHTCPYLEKFLMVFFINVYFFCHQDVEKQQDQLYPQWQLHRASQRPSVVSVWQPADHNHTRSLRHPPDSVHSVRSCHTHTPSFNFRFYCSHSLFYSHSLPVTYWPTPSTVTVGWPG